MLDRPHAIDIFSSEHKRNAFACYAEIRRGAKAPQLRKPLFGQFWLITRHNDVVRCLRDTEAFAKNPLNAGQKKRQTMPSWLPSSIRALENSMLDMDGDVHRRLRGSVNHAFTRRRVELLRQSTEVVAAKLLDDMAGKPTVDLVRDFALPLPLSVICALLGVPPQDQGKFQNWSSAILQTPANWRLMLSVPKILAFVRYIKRLIADRRAKPTDDFVSALVHPANPEDQLTEDELIAMLMLLIIAGFETTVNLIGSGTLALLQAPEQKARFINEPALMPSAIEELLRFTAPIETATERYAIKDVEMHGVTIKRGELVMAAIGSANHDETHFEDPDRMILDRGNNAHLGFGLGPHFCLGAGLARMEADVAFTRLFERYPDLALATPAADLEWRPTPVVRGLKALPVKTNAPAA